MCVHKFYHEGQKARRAVILLAPGEAFECSKPYLVIPYEFK